MAPRANSMGFLRLSLVTCPVALFPATSDSEKISFNQINRNTGHRIRYLKVDADTGEEVASDDIMKGYAVIADLMSGQYSDPGRDVATLRSAGHRMSRTRSSARSGAPPILLMSICRRPSTISSSVTVSESGNFR